VLKNHSISQRDFAKKAGVPQGWLSRVLSGKRKSIGMASLDRIKQACLSIKGSDKQEEVEKVFGELAATSAEELLDSDAKVAAALGEVLFVLKTYNLSPRESERVLEMVLGDVRRSASEK